MEISMYGTYYRKRENYRAKVEKTGKRWYNRIYRKWGV